MIELLVDISIIALLSSIVLASLNDTRGKARDTQRLSDIHQIQTAINLYANDNGGNYPQTGINQPVCLGKSSSQTCWVGYGSFHGDDSIKSAFSPYISLPQDPSPTRSGGGDSYLYLNNSSSQGASVHCGAYVLNGPMIVWLPEKTVTNDASCKGDGVYACCGSFGCNPTPLYCAYTLN